MEQSNQIITGKTNEITATLFQTIEKTESLVDTLAKFAVHISPDSTSVSNIFIQLMDDGNTSSIIAGGGFWPEPFSIDQSIERGSHFWGRKPDGGLDYFNDYNKPENSPYFGEDWYVQAKHLKPGTAYWSQAYFDPYSYEPMTTCSMAYFKNGIVAGVVTLDISVSHLGKLMNRLIPRDQGYAFLLDKNHRFISYPEKGMVVHTTDECGTGPHFPSLLTQAKHEPNLAIMASGIETTGITNKDLVLYNEEDHIIHQPVAITISKLPKTQWTIVTVLSQEKIESTVAIIINQLNIALLVPLLLVSILGFYLTSTIFVKPIRKMVQILGNSWDGDTNSQLTLLPVIGCNETRELTFWFNLRTKALVQARKEAEEASRVKSTFLANMSHEIRTPMNGIIGATDLLDNVTGKENQSLVRLIKGSSEALMTVLNDILDYSKLEAGQFTITQDPMDLVESVSHSIDLFKSVAEKKNIELRFLNNLGTQCWVTGDTCRIRQITMNLLSNAVKFTKSGSVTVSLFRTEGPESFFTIEVKDTGIGISPDDQTKIFKVFTQTQDSYVRTAGGTGLGLTISRQLAKIMGGDISISSNKGIGSTFSVLLPLAKATAPIISDSAKSPRKLFGLRVLLAEDNLVNQRVGSALLKRHGCHVTIANNGAQAFEIASEETFDLVLMDLQMPIMDGLQATRKIRMIEGKKGTVAIVALTANIQQTERQKCMDVGMDGFLTKPLRNKDLLGELSRHSRDSQLA